MYRNNCNEEQPTGGRDTNDLTDLIAFLAAISSKSVSEVVISKAAFMNSVIMVA